LFPKPGDDFGGLKDIGRYCRNSNYSKGTDYSKRHHANTFQFFQIGLAENKGLFWQPLANSFGQTLGFL
jgi:hypothetical protein